MKKYIPVLLCGMLLGFQGVHAESAGLKKSDYEILSDCINHSRELSDREMHALAAEGCMKLNSLLINNTRSTNNFYVAVGLEATVPSLFYDESWMELFLVALHNLDAALKSHRSEEKRYLADAACYQLNLAYKKYSDIRLDEDEGCFWQP